jgi:hypothetical protein
MKRYVVSYTYDVYTETPIEAFREIAARMAPKVNEHIERMAQAMTPAFDNVVPNALMTGEAHQLNPMRAGWMCVVAIREHD